MKKFLKMKKLHLTVIAVLAMLGVSTEVKAYDVNYSHINPAADNYFDANTGGRRTEPFCKLDGTDMGPLVQTNVNVGTRSIRCKHPDYACDKDDDGEKDETCEGSCYSGTINKNYRKMYAWKLYNDFFTTNLCYRYSCYYQAMAYADLNYVVQPLNKHASIVSSIIAGYANDGRLTAKTGIYGRPSDRGIDGLSNAGNKFDKRYVVPAGENIADHYRHYENVPGRWNLSNAKPDELIASPEQSKNYEPGGGTSAFQGLLWSWRMLSNKWQGKWANMSYYEANNSLFADGVADRVSKLPSAELSKHIILVSDGLDNDGLANSEVQSHMSEVIPRNNHFPAVRADSGFGFEFNPQPSTAVHKATAETCDAHSPEASITVEDYVKICESMTQQGITVYAIVFDSVVNEKLKRCVLATERGVYIDNTSVCSASVNNNTKCQPNPTGIASPSYLQEALSKVFAAIAAQSVRLVE